jgi:hypothetical protein
MNVVKARELILLGTHKLHVDCERDDRFDYIFSERIYVIDITNGYYWRYKQLEVPREVIKLSEIDNIPKLFELKKGVTVMYTGDGSRPEGFYTIKKNVGVMSDVVDKDGEVHRLWNYLLKPVPKEMQLEVHDSMCNQTVSGPRMSAMGRVYTEDDMLAAYTQGTISAAYKPERPTAEVHANFSVWLMGFNRNK